MAQRVTYRRRLSYNTKSNKTRVVRPRVANLLFFTSKRRPVFPNVVTVELPSLVFPLSAPPDMPVFLCPRSTSPVHTVAAVAQAVSATVQRGVRQGCPLSGLLFNLFINDILDGVAPITVPGLPRDINPIRGLMYADDVAVFADSEQSLLAASTAIEQWANQWEMQFGVAKCGIISFTGHLAPRLDNPLDIRLHGQLVSRVESYKYLGVLIDSKLDHSAWLKQETVCTRAHHFRPL
ncbi:hypothetical protein BASA62_003023 [Batrachochytrium salamandrivorans]|nr:hypothetical protein BASA62_003023 [Batrachochytrium salamandrivorans]